MDLKEKSPEIRAFSLCYTIFDNIYYELNGVNTSLIRFIASLRSSSEAA